MSTKSKKRENKIKAIVFDVGGVITKEQTKRSYKDLARKFKFDLLKFQEARRKYVWEALVKKKPTFEYERRIAKDLGINSNKFIDCWQRLRKENTIIRKQSMKILKILSRNYLLCTLTNVSPAHEVLRIKNNLYSPFKINFKSCDLGFCKPHLRMFRHFLRKLKEQGIKAKETIFIDDREKNIAVAKSLRINSILFKNNKQLVQDLKKLGVKI